MPVFRVAFASIGMLFASCAAAEGLMDALLRRFVETDFEFVRGQTNAPFLPVAWVNGVAYDETSLISADGPPRTAQQRSISQGAFAAVPIGERDLVAVGEWVGWTSFEFDGAAANELEVFSVALPVGWARQVSPQWQVAAFAAPLGHRSSADASWYWETLGGVFARYLRSERITWLFGVYADVAPLEDFYTPYLGATFLLNERWSINAVMPWPSVTYAPTTDLLFRAGVAPSGASWSYDGERVRMELSAWNFGVAMERRVHKSIWMGVEIGVSGLRGLSFVGGEWQDVEARLDEQPFALLTVNVRPAAERVRDAVAD